MSAQASIETEDMKRRIWSTLRMTTISLHLSILPWVCLAQTPSLPSGPQNQPGQNPQSSGSLTIPNPLAQPSSISSTASGASTPQGVTIPSSQGKSFGTIGTGLPGMTGGPSLTSPLGAQDPSSRYMRPSVLAPLFCDPSINIPC